MLLNLHIKNIALIDEVEIDFSEGLNVLTGETGAGKSILIDSVNFALGARMPKDIVRDDEKGALCELVFSVDDEDTISGLAELDIEPEDGQIILSRKMSGGKSSLRCNGETVTASMARQIAALLIDIHGQHEHQSLLHTDNHRKILDKYCGSEMEDLQTKYSKVYSDYKKVKAEYDEACASAGSSEGDADYCAFVISEIENAALRIGEDDELEEKYSRMNNSRKIAESVQAVREYMYSEEGGAASNVSRASGYLKSVISIDSSAQELYAQLLDIDGLIQDFERSLTDYEDELVFSPEELAQCEERLNEINRLKMKYAPTIEGILQHQEEEQEKLDKLSDYDQYLDNLKVKCDELYAEVKNYCDKIHELRNREAKKLASDIKESLRGLNFLDAEFEIDVEASDEHITGNGYDCVEFIISTNPGEKLMPLTQVASGGELSRIMLGLKDVFALKDAIGTLIFDEIDTGISGRTANLVADKMTHIASAHQVICVTHLPQIASHADAHLLIEKSVTDGRTSTSVRQLDNEASVMELARMLSGAEITEATVANAREMKNAK